MEEKDNYNNNSNNNNNKKTSTTKTTTSTTTTIATTTERITMKPTSTFEAYRQENEERWPEQHSTSTG
jgi:hypothetical protein